MKRRPLRAASLWGGFAALLLALPAPAAAAPARPLHLPPRISIELPGRLGTITVPLGHHAAPQARRDGSAAAPKGVRTAASPGRVRRQPRALTGPVAVTAPGLISVVPVGPLPSALRPRVAAAAPRPVARSAGGSPSPDTPAPPLGFWFAVVLVVLVFGSTSYLIGDRRRYNVAVSITNR
ncbi:MAG TPA: hypothetical protein VG899_00980 [Mycobacteriales bacterium]|nr:hypothetical protein [Mycobacteriales bacterium]